MTGSRSGRRLTRCPAVLVAVLAAVIGLVAVAAAAAQATASPFFRDGPRFRSEGWSADERRSIAGALALFPALEAWTAGSHVLNQTDSPWFGHELTTGVNLTLFALDWLNIDLAVTESYQFRTNPQSDWWFWARALITDLGLRADIDLSAVAHRWSGLPLCPAASFQVGFSHDCKHDVEAFYGRTAVHDVVSVSLYQALPDFRFTSAWSTRGDIRCTAEYFVGQIFQELTPEPYKARLSAEWRWYPAVWAERWRIFTEGRIAALAVGPGTAVILSPGWHADWRIQAGMEVAGQSGRVRLAWYADYASDPLVDNYPAPALTRGLNLAFIFAAP